MSISFHRVFSSSFVTTATATTFTVASIPSRSYCRCVHHRFPANSMSRSAHSMRSMTVSDHFAKEGILDGVVIGCLEGGALTAEVGARVIIVHSLTHSLTLIAHLSIALSRESVLIGQPMASCGSTWSCLPTMEGQRSPHSSTDCLLAFLALQRLELESLARVSTQP